MTRVPLAKVSHSAWGPSMPVSLQPQLQAQATETFTQQGVITFWGHRKVSDAAVVTVCPPWSQIRADPPWMQTRPVQSDSSVPSVRGPFACLRLGGSGSPPGRTNPRESIHWEDRSAYKPHHKAGCCVKSERPVFDSSLCNWRHCGPGKPQSSHL